ncbi:MAG: TSUP family transporter, partial [Candidatus Limnocylindria bacterium]
ADRLGARGAAAVVAFSFAVGVLLGLTSVGSGSLIILSMVFLFRMSARQIVGTNIAIALIMVIPAGLAHFAAGGIDAPRLALLMAGSVVGTVLGSRATMVVPDRALRNGVALLVLVSAVATIFRAL